MHIVRSRGLEGDHGTWDEFMKSKHPDGKFSLKPLCLVKTTLWTTFCPHRLRIGLSLGLEETKADQDISRISIDAISLCCEMVLSQDESEAHSVRVVAINSDFKVILDELFTPCHEAVQHLENASHTLSLADIQEKLLNLLSVDTIVVGHSLKLDLQALKLDHTKVLDTSQVFKYEYSGVPPKENNGYFETCIEFESIQPRRPSLDFLCKSILGYEEPPNNCLQKAEATMKLARAVVKKGAKTSIPLTDEMLASEKSTLFIPEEKIKRSKKLSPDS
ncbi:hypothetical protein Bca4012_081015 [Brassica carinata]